MRIEDIRYNFENKRMITEIQKTEKNSNTKNFDYYYRRGLTKEEQGKRQEKNNESPLKNPKTEKEKVREFKNMLNNEIGIERYQKLLQSTPNNKNQGYQEIEIIEHEEK